MAQLNDAVTRDQSVLGKVFYVDRKTGRVSGDGLFGNIDEDVKVLRNVSENVFEVLSTNKRSDVKLLSIEEFKTKTTFKYYFSWLGLLLTGDCNSP